MDRIDPRDLSALPVMTKHDMMSAFDDVVTNRSLNLELVEEALAAAGEVPAAIDGQYVAMASGGSSGQRGVFVLDRAALVGFILSLSRGLLARLEAFGGPPPGGLPIGMVAAASPVHATGLVVPFSDADDAPFRFHPAPATLPLAEIVERLNATRPAALYGYASMLHRLARERREGRLDITPIAVTSTSETLLPEVRETVAEAFGVPVGNTFGSTEGLVGTSGPGEEPLTFNSDLCIVELVDEDDQPVPSGTPSAKVLVTNLYNRAQPLIRYELTDSFVRQPDAAEHGHLRACGGGPHGGPAPLRRRRPPPPSRSAPCWWPPRRSSTTRSARRVAASRSTPWPTGSSMSPISGPGSPVHWPPPVSGTPRSTSGSSTTSIGTPPPGSCAASCPSPCRRLCAEIAADAGTSRPVPALR